MRSLDLRIDDDIVLTAKQLEEPPTDDENGSAGTALQSPWPGEQYIRYVKELLITRVFATLDGWLLKSALQLTLHRMVTAQAFVLLAAGTGVPMAHGRSNACNWFSIPISLTVFSIMVFASAFLELLVHRSGLGAVHTLVIGLRYMPSWAWKDVVEYSFCYGLCVSDACYIGHAAIVTLSSALIQVLAEAFGEGLNEGTYRYSLVSILRNSLGLGVGYAWNSALKETMGVSWARLTFQAAYVATLSVVTPVLQLIAWRFLAHLQDVVDSRCKHGYPLGLHVLAAAKFIVVSLMFILGWAYNGLLDALLAPLISRGIIGQLLASVIITALGVCVVLVSQCTRTLPRFPGKEESFDDGVMMIAGLNIGWSWMDFCVACFGGSAVSLDVIWPVTILVITISLAAEGLLFKVARFLVQRYVCCHYSYMSEAECSSQGSDSSAWSVSS